MAPTVEECITLPNGMKMPRLALGTWKVFIIGLSTNLSIYNSKIFTNQRRREKTFGGFLELFAT